MLYRIPTDYLQNLAEFSHKPHRIPAASLGTRDKSTENFAESPADPHLVPYNSSEDASKSSKHRPRTLHTLTRRSGFHAANWDPATELTC